VPREQFGLVLGDLCELVFEGFSNAGVECAILSNRSLAKWALGYPEAARSDIDKAIGDAREIAQAATLMYTLGHAPLTYLHCGDYAKANAIADELITLADEKGAMLWKASGMAHQGLLFALTGKTSNAIRMITSGINAWRSTGATVWIPVWSMWLAGAYANLGQFDEARRCLGETIAAVQTTKERLWEAEANRIAGEIALLSPEQDRAAAEGYFERALTVAGDQRAKSWELRTAMSMARLWRDQGKPQQARELLAPVYGWFTEGFDTRDLKDAKALLEQLASCKRSTDEA
jgi:predicted ATPase